MPSKSAKQHKLMQAVAHNKDFAKKVGIPQSVGKDFSEADKGKKFRFGGSTSPMEAGINKQKTHHGKVQMPNASLNKYIGKKAGGVMKMEHSEKKEMKADLSQDKKMIKRAFSMHDKQEHKGEKTDLSKLKKGGMAMKNMCGGGKAVKKMAKGGMAETMGPRTMAKDVEAGSNKHAKFGESALQKRGKTRGIQPTMPAFKKGGSIDGIAIRGKTKGKYC